VGNHFWAGMAIILLGGMLNGSFALPMKSSRTWHWENTWLVFAVISLVFLPLILALVFVPELQEVYRSVPVRALVYPLAFGFFWGIAQLTFGLGIKAVGMALAMAVVAGLSCLSGSLVPLLVFNPADLFRPRGLLLLVSMPLLFVGLGLYGRAGMRREKEQTASNSSVGSPGKNFGVGLAICIFTGIVGSSINLGFAFGKSIIPRSLQFGASPVTATYAVWALVLGAGFVPNLLYCLFLITRNRTWALFAQKNWMLELGIAIAMAFLWLLGVLAYGIGAGFVGVYGTSLGFALFTASQILSANTLGMLTGEWRATTSRTRKILASGVAMILASVIVLNLGGVF
jgi:L-rhamnose-H+ transport protein